MKNKQRAFWTGMLACSVGIWLTGCACTGKKGGFVVCKDNEQKGYATIACQPVDVEKAQGETAVFEVKAKGKNLVYQWFFRGTAGYGDVVDPNPSETVGGKTAQLTVLDVGSAKGGFYWCEIESTGLYGAPVRTRTRDAHLGIRSEVGGTGSGVIQVYPPQQANMPAPYTGSSSCGSHCGWVNYQNGGAGFDPDPGTTKGLAKVRIGTTYRDNTTFNVKWFDNLGNSGCAVNSTSPNTQKEFTINPSRIYFFTVYFISSCPPQGSQVFFELSFVP
jgi:hypothetical protein